MKMRPSRHGSKDNFLRWRAFVFTAWCMLTTAVGNKLLEDEDALVSGNKRIERNSHDHHSHGHENGHHGGEEVDLLDFFQQVGVRLTDGKDREGADDLGNDLDFLTPDVSPQHLANKEKMKELRQLFLSGGVSFGEIFAQLSGDSNSGQSKKSTTEKPHSSTARLPIKHHFHWEDPPTDLVMKNKVAEPVFENAGASLRLNRRGKTFATRRDRKGKALSMGGTIGGATTVTPEYLTETQYYSPSEFEDISRRQKPQENVLIGPLTSRNRQGKSIGSSGKTGDRRIDIDGNIETSLNTNKTSNAAKGSNPEEKDYIEEDYDYYEDYERLLKDYYEGDYNEETFNEDDSSIREESEEELPEITRTPRTPTRDRKIEGTHTQGIESDDSSRPLVGRKILSANPAQLHIENQHEMDHMMMMMLRNAIAQVEMEEHLLDVQDGVGRGGVRSNPQNGKNSKNKKKLQLSRFTPTKRPKGKTNAPFVPTKRPSVRARRPKILNNPNVNNNNLGQTLIPPESIRSGASVVDDYSDYEYIYFYDDYDQDVEKEDDRNRKSKQQRLDEMRKQKEERKRLETEQKRARDDKRLMEKEERERNRKEDENLRQAQLRLRQQEQLKKKQEEERKKLKEQEKRQKEKQQQQLQDQRRLELSKRLKEEQGLLRQQQFSSLDNSQQNKQFAQRQQSRLQSLSTNVPQQRKKQSQRGRGQERRRPKVLQSQTPRFRNRPAPVELKKIVSETATLPPQSTDIFNGKPQHSLRPKGGPSKRPTLLQKNRAPKSGTSKRPTLRQKNNPFLSRNQASLNPIVNRNKPIRKQAKPARKKPTKNTGRNRKVVDNQNRNFPVRGTFTTTTQSPSIFTTTNVPPTEPPKLVSTLVTPLVTKPTSFFVKSQNESRSRKNNLRRPNIPKRKRKQKSKRPVEPRIIPIANVRTPNAKPNNDASTANKSNTKGKRFRSSFKKSKKKNVVVNRPKSLRKSKAIGFGSRFESMFHKADNVPETSFTCSSQQYPGLYADPEVDCRVFHMCHKNGRRSSFLCPTGTSFDQRFMVCNWSKKVDCANAPNLYPLNRDIYKENENS